MDRQEKLNRLILEYFQDAKRAMNMDEDPRFEGFSSLQIRDARLALTKTGMLWKRGVSKDAVYYTTPFGRQTLEREYAPG